MHFSASALPYTWTPALGCSPTQHPNANHRPSVTRFWLSGAQASALAPSPPILEKPPAQATPPRPAPRPRSLPTPNPSPVSSP